MASSDLMRLMGRLLPHAAPRQQGTRGRGCQCAQALAGLGVGAIGPTAQVFSARALEGDVASGALVAKIIERRCTMLGLYTPPATMLQVIEAEAPRETSTEKIRAAIDRIRGRLPKPDGPEDPDKLN